MSHLAPRCNPKLGYWCLIKLIADASTTKELLFSGKNHRIWKANSVHSVFLKLLTQLFHCRCLRSISLIMTGVWMLGTGCGYLQAPFFMLTSGCTVLWCLARKPILTENISSKFNLIDDAFRSCKTRNQNNLSTHSADCGSTSSLFPCKDCTEEPDGVRWFIWGVKCRMRLHLNGWDGTPSKVD